MTETLEDFKRWIEAGVVALFPHNVKTLAALRATIRHLKGCRSSDSEKRGLRLQVQNQAALLESQIRRLYVGMEPVFGEHEYVTIGAFIISRTEYAGPNQVPTTDGSLDNERIDGWLVQCAVPICGMDGHPDSDIVEVGKFPSAAEAAKKVIELFMLDAISSAFQSQAEADAFERAKAEAAQVF